VALNVATLHLLSQVLAQSKGHEKIDEPQKAIGPTSLLVS
jgi:hypothetical protein